MRPRFASLVRSLLVVVILLAACAAARCELYSNVLQNSDFETGSGEFDFPPWVPFGEAHRYSTPKARSGSYAVVAWTSCYPPGEWSACGLYQPVPAVEGQVWEGSVWALPDATLTGRTYGAVHMDFCNAATQVVYEVKSALQVLPASSTSQWTRLTVRGRTTLYTKFVRIKPVIVWAPECSGGAVWFDDASLYQASTSRVVFAGRTWTVIDWNATPGPNWFSTNCAYVDGNGSLHLAMKKQDGQWHAGAVECEEHPGYGEYRWYMGSRLDLIDSNAVLGLFTFAQEPIHGTNQNEVDIEVSRAFPGTQTNCLVLTVQPYNIPGYTQAFPLDLTNDQTTHRFVWRPDEVWWQSYYGHTPAPADASRILAEHRFRSRGIPLETNETINMNFWLFFTNAPAGTQVVDMVIDGFEFVPFNGLIFGDDFDDDVVAPSWQAWTGGGAAVDEAGGRLVIRSPTNGAPAGVMTTGTIHRNERGERYVFMATLASVGVFRARSGEDVRAVLALGSEPGESFASSNAAVLQGRYDAEFDRLNVVCTVKTGSPDSDGTVLFDGTATNISPLAAAGGIVFRLELDPWSYRVRLAGGAGGMIPVATNAGAAEGAQSLGEELNYAYWFLGGQNSDTQSEGAVEWASCSVGIDSPPEPPVVSAADAAGGALRLAWSSAYDKVHSLYATTNLNQPFALLASGVGSALPLTVFTNTLGGAPAAYYRVGAE